MTRGGDIEFEVLVGHSALPEEEVSRCRFEIESSQMPSLKEKILSEPRTTDIQGEEEEKEMETQKGWPNSSIRWGTVRGPREHGILRGRDVGLPDASKKSEKVQLDLILIFQRRF